MPFYYRVCKTDLKVLSYCVFLCLSIFVSQDPLNSKMYCNFHQLGMRTKLVSYNTSSTIKTQINLVLLQSLCRFDRLGRSGSTKSLCNFLKYPTSEKTVNLGFSMYFFKQKCYKCLYQEIIVIRQNLGHSIVYIQYLGYIDLLQGRSGNGQQF